MDNGILDCLKVTREPNAKSDSLVAIFYITQLLVCKDKTYVESWPERTVKLLLAYGKQPVDLEC